LRGADTTYEIGGLIAALVPGLGADSIRRIEEAILALRRDRPSDYGELVVKRLIKVLGPHCLSEESKSLLAEMQAEPERYENRPLFSIGETSWEPVTSKSWLEREGVDVEKKENSSLVTATTALDEANRASGEVAPSPGDLSAKVKKIQEELLRPHGAEEKVVSWAQTEIATAAATLARSWKKLEEADRHLVRQLILEASTSPLPEYEAKYYENWKSASWSPAPRNSAAQALPWLLHYDPENVAVKEHIKALVHDPVPTVRFLLAAELWCLREHNPDFLTELLQEYLRSEKNETILGSLCISLENASNLPSVRHLVPNLYQRLIAEGDFDADSDFDYRRTTIRMMVDQEMRGDESWPLEAFASWKENPIRFAREIQSASFRLCQWCEPQNEEAFIEKAIQRQMEFLGPCLDVLRHLIRQGKEVDAGSKKQTPALFRMIDQIVSRMYFDCDFDRKFTQQQPEKTNRAKDKKLQFFEKCLPVLQLLATYSGDEAGLMIPSTAYHFMELLRGALEHGADVKVILQMAFKVASGGEKLNYSLDRMAVDETVKLAEVVVADHRQEISRDRDSMKALLGLLDIFARAGWPEALKMIWRLDELYR
jgi:hypothetical protein